AVLPLLTGHSTSVLQSVDYDLAHGKYIVIHQNPIVVDQWQGSGWISLDPESGSAAYLISGGLGSVRNRPAQVINGGSGTRSQSPAELNQALLTMTDTLLRFSQDIRQILSPIVGDPIDVTTGSFLYHNQDLASLGGLGIPLRFDRFYSSARHS